MSNFMSAALTVDDIYPVGSIYMSVNATDPANLFGGVWERIKERFLLGAGDTHTPGSTGGEFDHKLITAEMPNHGHSMYSTYEGTYHGTAVHVFNHLSGAFSASNTYSDLNNIIKPYGGDNPHNNTPPLFGSVYLASHRVKLAKAGWRYE